jgi:acyl-CoA thioester hydrolase
VTDVSQPFSFPVVPRYAEIDQQGVVFNGHYLTWFDEAATAFFDHLGISFAQLNACGSDVQVVHTELDYVAPVRWRDAVRVVVISLATGTTSLTLGFEVWRRGASDDAERVAVTGRTVYVVVSTADWAKRPVPTELRSALTSVAAQGLPTGGTVAS